MPRRSPESTCKLLILRRAKRYFPALWTRQQAGTDCAERLRSCEKIILSPLRRRDAEKRSFIFYPPRLCASAVKTIPVICSQLLHLSGRTPNASSLLLRLRLLCRWRRSLVVKNEGRGYRLGKAEPFRTAGGGAGRSPMMGHDVLTRANGGSRSCNVPWPSWPCPGAGRMPVAQQTPHRVYITKLKSMRLFGPKAARPLGATT
jgi:hypothetical protein